METETILLEGSNRKPGVILKYNPNFEPFELGPYQSVPLSSCTRNSDSFSVLVFQETCFALQMAAVPCLRLKLTKTGRWWNAVIQW